jgi:hypothetical protein
MSVAKLPIASAICRIDRMRSILLSSMGWRSRRHGSVAMISHRARREITAASGALSPDPVMVREGAPSTPFSWPGPQAVDGAPSRTMTMRGRRRVPDDSVVPGRAHKHLRTAASWRLRIVLRLNGLTVEHVSYHLRRGGQRMLAELAINLHLLVLTFAVLLQGRRTDSKTGSPRRAVRHGGAVW